METSANGFGTIQYSGFDRVSHRAMESKVSGRTYMNRSTPEATQTIVEGFNMRHALIVSRRSIWRFCAGQNSPKVAAKIEGPDLTRKPSTWTRVRRFVRADPQNRCGNAKRK